MLTTIETDNTGGSQGWNIAETLGKANAKAKTSNFTSSSRAKSGPSVNNAGVTWRIKSLSGEVTNGVFEP